MRVYTITYEVEAATEEEALAAVRHSYDEPITIEFVDEDDEDDEDEEDDE